MREETVASGDTEAELIASAKEYKRLLGMAMEQYLAELSLPNAKITHAEKTHE